MTWKDRVVNATANFFIDLIKQAGGNNQLLWKHINNLSRKKDTGLKCWELKMNNKLTQDEDVVDFFCNSVHGLATPFENREIVIIPQDYAYAVLSQTEVSNEKEIKIFTRRKNSKIRDIYGIDSCLIKRN